MSTPQRLFELLRDKGCVPDGWHKAVAAVDRALFIPDVIGDLDRRADPRAWNRVVYSDRPIVTRTDNGCREGSGPATPTSSSSMPSIMLEMLDLLHVADDARVLEIGTGTGFNAAWLSHRLGDGNVTSVEYDAYVREQAVRNLAAAGFHPRVIEGDGLRGWPDRAPYDRVVATCTVREIPYSWVEQASSGARIVAPWGNGFFSGSFVTLVVDAGTATGRFSGNPAFMFARQHRAPPLTVGDVYHGEKGSVSATSVDPRDLLQDDALFFLGLFLGRATFAWGTADDGSGEGTLWLLADDGGSWAGAEFAPGRSTYEVEQFGPRRLWDSARTAYRRWQSLGCPERARFGLTVDRRGQRVWLDDPATVIVRPA